MIRNLLLTLSGIDRAMLARAPRDTAKYVGIGGAVLMTATLAAVSSGYAFQVALGVPVVFAAFLGILWGLGILNLDRWIVVATKRQKGVLKNIGMALPRLVLALVIGAIISEPLVLRVFAGEIETELRVMQSELRAEFESDLRENPRYRDLGERKQEIVELQRDLAEGIPADAVSSHPEVQALNARLAGIDKELLAAEKAIACEGLGTCGSGNAGAGPVFAQNLARRDRLVQEKVDVGQRLGEAEESARSQARDTFQKTEASERQRLESMQRDVADTERSRADEVREHEMRVADADGLLARIEALHRLSKDHGAMETARWALFLFILAIECMPVLVKLMMNLAPAGQYERLQELEDEADYERAVLRLRAEQEEARMAADTAIDAAEQKARTELHAHVEATRLVLAAQVELIRKATEEWQRQQEHKLAEDVSQFVAGTMTGPTGEPRLGGSFGEVPGAPPSTSRPARPDLHGAPDGAVGVYATSTGTLQEEDLDLAVDDADLEELLSAADAGGATTAHVPSQAVCTPGEGPHGSTG